MFKKIGLPVIAVLGLLAIAPHQAKADERFGFRAERAERAERTERAEWRPAYRAYPVYPVAPVVEVPAPVYVDGGRGRHDMQWDRRHDSRFRR